MEEPKLGEYLHFRVHTETIDLVTFVAFLKQETDLLMIVKEFGKMNREHIHATLILKTAKSTFIDRLKQKFPSIVGNKSYGLRPVRDFDKNARYTYKGSASDYPDILYTSHTEEQWKTYYKRFWETFKDLHKVNTGCQNASLCKIVDDEPKSKSKSTPFTLRISEELWSEHTPLFHSIWHFHGAKQYEPINNLASNQDYLADYVERKMGSVAKAQDQFIFERIYRGVYSYILFKCPDNITFTIAVKKLDRFRGML